MSCLTETAAEALRLMRLITKGNDAMAERKSDQGSRKNIVAELVEGVVEEVKGKAKEAAGKAAQAAFFICFW